MYLYLNNKVDLHLVKQNRSTSIFFEKGVSVVYYGEEIGMVDADISYENTMDPWGCNCGPINYVNCSRDPARTPMQWDGAKNAGFSQSVYGTNHSKSQ